MKDCRKMVESRSLNIFDGGDEFRGEELNIALDAVFGARQKQIILSKLLKIELSEGEEGDYSRTIKPKLQGILNPMLQKLASRLL